MNEVHSLSALLYVVLSTREIIVPLLKFQERLAYCYRVNYLLLLFIYWNYLVVRAVF